MRDIPLKDALELGRRFVLDTGDPWRPEPFQVAVIDALCRGVDRVWLEIPEGNAKTTLAAIVALIHTFFVTDADMPVAASSRDQAGTLLRQATGIVRRTPGLLGHFKPLEGHRRVVCTSSGGRLQIYAADAGTGDGVIPSLAILEELHRHPTLELFRTWGGKLGKRHGQILIISTAGEPGGEYEIAKEAALAECRRLGQVTREGSVTAATMPGFEMRLHALVPGDDVEDLDLVKTANPLSTVTVEQLAGKRSDPTWSRQHWSRFTCGIPQRDRDSAVSAEEWRGLRKTLIPKREPIMAGLDLGWKHDTTAISPFWMPEPTRRVFGKPEILTPPRDGTTSLQPQAIRDAFLRIHERNPITRVAMDPSAGGQVIAEWLEDPNEGIGCTVVEVSPSNVVQAKVYAAWMEAIRMKWIEHPHDPEFDAHVLNAIAKQISHDRYRFDRPNQSRAAKFQDRRVIDALIAASGVHWHATAGLDEKPERPFNLADYRIAVL